MQNLYLNRVSQYLDQITALEVQPTGLHPSCHFDPTIKAVIFDIYGTLLISASGDLDKSTLGIDDLKTALNEGGFSLLNSAFGDNILKLMHQNVMHQQTIFVQNGHPYPEVDMVKVWRDTIDEALTHKWIEASGPVNIKTLTVVFEILCNRVWPMPGMQKIIHVLNDKKIPLGIVSNAQFYTPLLMNYFINGNVSKDETIQGFRDDLSVFSYKIFRSKPDVFLFEELAKNLKANYGLLPPQVLFVGNDMLKDVWSAHQLNFKTAFFAGDMRSYKPRVEHELCKELKPDFVLTSLDQVFEILSINS